MFKTSNDHKLLCITSGRPILYEAKVFSAYIVTVTSKGSNIYENALPKIL